MSERTRYPRHAPSACEAVTTTGNECRYLGKDVLDVVDRKQNRRTVRLCRTHARSLDKTGNWFSGGWPLTIRQDGQDIDVWRARQMPVASTKSEVQS